MGKGWHTSPKLKIPVMLTKEEIQAMFKAAPNIRDQILCIFLYYTGFRVSEASNCKTSDVSFPENTIKVRQGKGAKDRIIAMTPQLRAALQVWLKRETNPESYIFEGQKKKPLHPRQIYRIVSETAKLAGITKKVHPHSMRHSIAMHLRRDGNDLIVISRFLGHNDVSTTQIYADADITDIAEMMKKFH